jgi:histidinol phosphatase-like enzyme
MKHKIDLPGGRHGCLLILDRDGVINEISYDPDDKYYYILTPQDFIFKPGALEAFRLMNDLECDICICSKQRCLGKGLLTWKGLREIHAYMNSQIEAYGGRTVEKIFIEPLLPAKTFILQEALLAFNCHPSKALLLDDSLENLLNANEKNSINGIQITEENSLLLTIMRLIDETNTGKNNLYQGA